MWFLFNKIGRIKHQVVITMFQAVLLTCIKRLSGERTASGIFHMLTGKRSSQTMQDVKGYRLEPFFGIYKSLSRKRFDETLQRLTQSGHINISDEGFPLLTLSGEDKEKQLRKSWIHFSGLKNHQLVMTFEKRLFLLIQTFTNMKASHRNFIPIVDEPIIQNWVRGIYKTYQKNAEGFIDSIYEEMKSLLNELPPEDAHIFVHRLTGSGIIGLTMEQLAKEAGETKEDAYLRTQHVLHFLFTNAKREPKTYAALAVCAAGLDSSGMITDSAKRTFRYIEQGLSLKEVMEKRRLKESTIQDHIVEAALVLPHFSTEPFLTEAEKRVIIQKAEVLNTQRLKHIKESLQGKYSYFQIRLALAQYQHDKKEGMTHG
ncbi:hypothetical protein EQV77_02770 [Halobacillus fulvus]|nr:hypothetical protein EQV77_02770 [Halobacillus fulvus]